MRLSRREVVATSAGVLAGCAELTVPGGDSATRTPTEDYSLVDFRMNNGRGQPYQITTEFTPKGASEPTLTISRRLPPDGFFELPNVPLLDKSGHVTATAQAETGATFRDERDWEGDITVDNRGLRIHLWDDGLVIHVHVA